MKVDQKTGLVEMIMDKLEDKDEGTYTFQLQDGKATNQSSLVLIGDGKLIYTMWKAGKNYIRVSCHFHFPLFSQCSSNKRSCHSTSLPQIKQTMCVN